MGWILTDLIPDENTSGQVKYLRHKDSHFMSAQECITAAYHQNKYTNPCKESANGKFGSKFVSVIVSGIWLRLFHIRFPENFEKAKFEYKQHFEVQHQLR